MTNWATLALCLIGLSYVYAQQPFLKDRFNDPDSSEYGVNKGSKSTNCPCGWTNKPKNLGRIIGGVETGINEYPFIAGIASKRFKVIFCGGTIISPYHVITATHCTRPQQGNPLIVIVGEHDTIRSLETEYTKVHDVAKVIEHEKYNPLGHPNDISLLVLDKNIEFNQFVGPACLPRKPKDLTGEIVKVIGWGKTTPDGSGSTVLLKVNLKVIPHDQCVKSVPVKMSTNPPTQLCTWRDGKDSCKGDSGGPVVWLDPETNRYTLVGAVSFGLKCQSNNPGVNTLISAYIDWIDANIKASTPAPTCAKV